MVNPTTDARVSGSPRRTLLFGIAVVILLADQITKIAAVEFIDPRQPISLIGDVVTLRLVRNPGAAFSMATGMTWVLTIMALIVTFVVIRIGSRLRSTWWILGLGLVLGGASGNLIDRIFRAPGPFRGHVVDYFSVGWFPVFNVADSAVVCGAILIVVLNLLNVDPGGQADLLTGRRSSADRTDEVPGAEPENRAAEESPTGSAAGEAEVRAAPSDPDTNPGGSDADSGTPSSGAPDVGGSERR